MTTDFATTVVPEGGDGDEVYEFGFSPRTQVCACESEWDEAWCANQNLFAATDDYDIRSGVSRRARAATVGEYRIV